MAGGIVALGADHMIDTLVDIVVTYYSEIITLGLLAVLGYSCWRRSPAAVATTGTVTAIKLIAGW